MYRAILLLVFCVTVTVSFRVSAPRLSPRPHDFYDYLERSLAGEKFDEEETVPGRSDPMNRILVPRNYGLSAASDPMQATDDAAEEVPAVSSDENRPTRRRHHSSGRHHNRIPEDANTRSHPGRRFGGPRWTDRFNRRFSETTASPLNGQSSSEGSETGSGGNDSEEGDDATLVTPEPIRRHSKRQLTDSSFNRMETELRDVPKEHWSCCTLGMLAGDKGFLCVADFYSRKIMNRNANRVHNRRLTGTYFDNGEPTESGMELMTSFSSCVTDRQRASEFNSCCDIALNAYGSRTARWDRLHSVFAEVTGS